MNRSPFLFFSLYQILRKEGKSSAKTGRKGGIESFLWYNRSYGKI